MRGFLITILVLLSAMFLPQLRAGAAAQSSHAAKDPKQVAPTVGLLKIHPNLWPVGHSIVKRDPAMEARITRLLARMSVEEKVGQVVQPEFKSMTPEDVRTYHIGSIENGGGSVPGGNKHASAKDWVNLIEPYYEASVDPKAHKNVIPLIWASDAVHGHNNVFGATLFPHNIGLGAAHDPELMKRIGAVTAAEVRAVGMDWTFSPTIAVARDDRWGRSYESYSEDPKIVSAYARAAVEGIEGTGTSFLDKDHVISTAKHFLGDGSTEGGRDQGDSLASEADLARLHAAGYKSAIDAGVQSVMASYNSWHGVKMHGNKALLTGILKDHMGFDGMIMGDWLAHGQIPGCTNSDCAAAFNAGLDVFNQPQDFKLLHANLVRDVKGGVISISRLDDAVRRILRVKFRAGVFDEPAPKDRPNTFKPLGSPEHRAIAREAVRKSLVLLKNNTAENQKPLLPIRAGARILVAGDGADSVAMQSGGWTLSWQGKDNGPEDFPGATSIYKGISDAAKASGGDAILSVDGSFAQKPDVAIVVFGETPYAEFQGDQTDVALHHDNVESLELIKKLKSQGVPVVVVLLSGRPLYINPQINAADAFVAAWLPGSEGEGVADVLLADATGHARYDFQGRLSFSWPKRPDQTPLNVGDAHYDPQFPYGFGLSYAHPANTPTLNEVAIATRYGERNVYVTAGEAWNGYGMSIGDSNAPHMDYVGTRTTLYGNASLTLSPTDSKSLRLVWNGKSKAWFEVAGKTSTDISREANGAMMLAVTLKLNGGVTFSERKDAVKMGVGAAMIDLTQRLSALPVGSAQRIAVPLSCFAKPQHPEGQDLSHTATVLRIEGKVPLDIDLIDVRLIETLGNAQCPAD